MKCFITADHEYDSTFLSFFSSLGTTEVVFATRLVRRDGVQESSSGPLIWCTRDYLTKDLVVKWSNFCKRVTYITISMKLDSEETTTLS